MIIEEEERVDDFSRVTFFVISHKPTGCCKTSEVHCEVCVSLCGESTVSLIDLSLCCVVSLYSVVSVGW